MLYFSLTVLFVACTWFLISYLVLAFKCFALSKGADFPRYQLLIANPIFMYRFIFRLGHFESVRNLVVSTLLSVVAIIVGVVLYLLS